MTTSVYDHATAENLEKTGLNAYCTGDLKTAMDCYKRVVDMITPEVGEINKSALELKANCMSHLAQTHLDTKQAYSAHKVLCFQSLSTC